MTAGHPHHAPIGPPRRRRPPRSLASRLLTRMAPAIALAAGMVIVALALIETAFHLDTRRQVDQEVTQAASVALIEPLWNLDRPRLQQHAATLLGLDRVHSITVADDRGQVLAEGENPNPLIGQSLRSVTIPLRYTDPFVDRQIGELQVRWLEATFLGALLNRAPSYAVVLGITIVAASVIVYSLTTRHVQRPARTLIDGMAIAGHDRPAARRAMAHLGCKDGLDRVGAEFASLRIAFERMLDALDARDATLTRAERTLQMALASSGHGLWQWSPVDDFVVLDARAKLLAPVKPSGLPPSCVQVRGAVNTHRTLMLDAVAPDQRQALATMFSNLVDGQNDCAGVDVKFVNDGLEQWATITATVVERHPDGLPRQVVGTIADLSERKATERRLTEAAAAANAANEAKSSFLATMSHEIRTPLNGILGMAQVLSMADLSAEQLCHVKTLGQSAESLANLLKDILDFSKIEAGSMELAALPIDLKTLADRVQVVHAPQARERDLDLVFTIDPIVGKRIGDEVRLEQILHNLVSNAIKFTETGRVEVHLGINQADGLCLTVTDTGIGIAAEDQRQIFERFRQVDGSYTRRAGGSGLGLAIVQGLAQAMGGWVSVQPILDQGTQFTVDLPLPRSTPDSDQETAPSCEDQDSFEHLHTPMSVLIAEDSPVNRQVMRGLLKTLPWRLHFANDGGEALAAVETETFDLILMDIQMPVLDGVMALKGIRAHQAANNLPPTPAVAVTGNCLPDQIKCYDAAGFAATVPKPVKRAALLRTIDQALFGPTDETAAPSRAYG